MPALSDYTSGTITLTNGSVNFTGAGTGWQAADFREGDTILGIEDNAGVEYVIATITGNGAGTLTQEWEGATGTYTYRMRYMADGARVTAQARNLIELLGNGNLQALAGLTGPGVPVFNGPHAMTIKPEADFVNGVAYNVQVDAIADRAAYDGQSAGFAVLVSDVGDGRSALFSKASNTSGDWTDPAYITGPIGPIAEVTVGTTSTGAPGTPASVTGTPTVDGIELDFTIPAGEGFSAEGDYSGSTAYVKGDVVQYQGSSWIALQATTGNTPPDLPTTSNAYWQLLARAGNDGAGTVTAVAAGDGISVDSTDPTEPVVALDIMGESVKTANYTLVAADYGGTFIADDTDPIEFAFEAAATLGAKWWAVVKNNGAGVLTLNPDGSETIDGEATLVLEQGQSCLVTCNGAELRALFQGSDGGPASSDPNGSIMALNLSDLKSSPLVLVDGVADGLKSETGIDAGESSGVVYDAGNDWYAPSGALGTIEHTDDDFSDTDLTSYTFSSQALGAADSARKIIVGIVGFGTTSTRTISSLTIGGVSASELYGVAPTASGYLGFWIADVPTGTTGDVAVTWSGAMSRCGIIVWRALGLASATTDTASGSGNPATDTISVPAGGAALGIHVNQGATTITWSGITEDTDFVIEGNTTFSGASDTFESANGSLALSATPASAGSFRHMIGISLASIVLDDMDLITEAYSAAEVPATAKVAVRVKEEEAIAVNTDLIVSVSRDDGSTWMAANLALKAIDGDFKYYEDNAVNVSGQPSGSDLRARIETANGKDVRVSGIVRRAE